MNEPSPETLVRALIDGLISGDPDRDEVQLARRGRNDPAAIYKQGSRRFARAMLGAAEAELARLLVVERGEN